MPTVGGVLDVGVTAGRFKIGHGLYNDYRDLDMTRTSVFLPMAIYDPRFRDFILAINGGALHGSLKAGALGSFDFMGYLGSQNFDTKEGSIHDIMVDAGMDPINRIDVAAFEGGNLTWNTPLDGLRLKYSMIDARDIDIRGSTSADAAVIPGMTGLDRSIYLPHYWNDIASIEYQRGNMVLAGEYSYTYYKSFVTVELPFGFGPPQKVTGHNATHAVALTGAYRVHPKVDVQGGWEWTTRLRMTTPSARASRSGTAGAPPSATTSSSTG